MSLPLCDTGDKHFRHFVFLFINSLTCSLNKYVVKLTNKVLFGGRNL